MEFVSAKSDDHGDDNGGNNAKHQQQVTEDEQYIIFQAVLYNNVELLAELLAENPALAENKCVLDGRTALHHAADRGHAKCAEMLIQAGADVDAVSVRDSLQTPIVMAAARGHTSVAELLVANGADLFHFDANGHSALQLAQMNGHYSCAHQLILAIEQLHKDAARKYQQLCAACIDGDTSTVLGILSDLGCRTTRKQVLNGTNPEKQKSALYLATEHGRLEAVQALLTVADHSIIYEPTGDTVLHAAIASKDVATVEAILQAFPFLMNAPNQERSLPLHWACRCGSAEIIRLLLNAEYPREELRFSELPQDWQRDAAMPGEILGYLFACDLNAVDQEQRTPLCLAVTEGHADIVDELAKFTVLVLDGSQRVGKGLAVDTGRRENPFAFDTYVNGKTPLIVAASNGAVRIVESLLNTGRVDVNLPIALTEAETNATGEAHCQNGSGALIEAARRRHLDVVRVLFRHGAFDYGNRSLAELTSSSSAEEQQFELISQFLRHLAFADTEHRGPTAAAAAKVSQRQQIVGGEDGIGKMLASGAIGKISKVAGQFIGGVGGTSGDGNGQPITACHLNWKGTGIRELRLDWLVSAAARLNPLTPNCRQPKNWALLAITRVDLSANQLLAVPPFLFSQLPSLCTLDLSKNAIHRLEVPPAGADWQSPQLATLMLDENMLEELPTQLFLPIHFPRLRHFSAHSNRLRRVPASIWTAPRLLELNLANNQLSELDSIDLMRRAAHPHGHGHHHGQFYRQAGTAAARISRQRQREKESNEKQQKKEEEEKAEQMRTTIQQQQQQPQQQQRVVARQSRPTTMQESPRQRPMTAIRGGDGDKDHSSSSNSRGSGIRRRRRERGGGGGEGEERHDEPEQQHQQQRATARMKKRNGSSATGSESGREKDSVDGEKCAGMMEEEEEVDIHRLNIWQKQIQVSSIDDNNNNNNGGEVIDDENCEKTLAAAGSALQILNLSGNKFIRMPTCLACCCPRLKRLDLSANCLTSIGPICCLPSALNHLDMSCNQLSQCFSSSEHHSTQLRQKLRNCEAPNAFAALANGVGIAGQVGVGSSSSIARHSRSRSKSVARSQRSLSVVRPTDGDVMRGVDHVLMMTDIICPHKSHCRLEALRTLNLANNTLRTVQLFLVESEGGREMMTTTMNVAAHELGILLRQQQSGKNDGGDDDDEAAIAGGLNWREGGNEQLKPYLLFPALTSMDLSGNLLQQLPAAVSLLSSLAILNLANNAELGQLPPELGLLDKLWSIGLSGCRLAEESAQIKQMVEAGNYKTTEVLSQLRQRLENAISYPKMKLMLLGSSGVGKTTLLEHMRLEGTVPKRSLQNESWSRRLGHSPVKGLPPSASNSPFHQTANSSNTGGRMPRSTSQQRMVGQQQQKACPNIFPVDVAEWVYEPPRRSSRNSKSDTTPQTAASERGSNGPITFRTWDFDGINQREQQAVEVCFFTRRCLFLLLWKVTDGDIALAELQEWLIAIQERAPNSLVLIIGTHSDFVRQQPQRFPPDYLATLDKQIQERFIVGADPEKRGLPRVLASLYLSCRSRDDVKSLCNLIYTCAGHLGATRSGGGGGGTKLRLADMVPASFMALERVVVNMVDEMRAKGQEPVLPFQQFWSVVTERLLLLADEAAKNTTNNKSNNQAATTKQRVVHHFRTLQDFRLACLFLHENGVICYFDDTLLRDFVFLDPPWLCSLLRGILAYTAHHQRRPDSSYAGSPNIAAVGGFPSSPPLHSSQVHQNSIVESVELYTAMKQAIRQHLMLSLRSPSSPGQQSAEHASAVSKHFRLFRHCGISLLRKFDLALPFQNGKHSLMASCLPDEYLLRADYPGAKVRVRTKHDKLKLHWDKCARPKLLEAPATVPPLLASPIRTYLEHRRLSRALAIPSIDEEQKMGGGSMKMMMGNNNNNTENIGGNSSGVTFTLDGTITKDFAKILTMEQCKEKCLRRLYMLHYIPQGFWARLTTRLMDDERVGNALCRLFRLSHATPNAVAAEALAEENASLACCCAVDTMHHQQQQQYQQQNRSEAICVALARTLNSGRVFLTMVPSTPNNKHRYSNNNENAKKQEVEQQRQQQQETSFIVLNTAREVTEEEDGRQTAGMSMANRGKEGKQAEDEMGTLIKCCEKGIEAWDDDALGAGGENWQQPEEEEEEVMMMLLDNMESGNGGGGIEWLLWSTGMEVRALGTPLFLLRQFLPLASVQDLNYSNHQLFRRFENGQWRPLSTPNHEGHQRGVAHMVELLVPRLKCRLKWRDTVWQLSTDVGMATRVMVLVGSILDDLLEDWYPQLGTRFVLSSHGQLLVDRLVPCDQCALEAIREEERYWLRENINRNPAASPDFIPPPKAPTRSASTKFATKSSIKSASGATVQKRYPKSKSTTTMALKDQANADESGGMECDIGTNSGGDDSRKKSTSIAAAAPSPVYMFSIEECILEARRLLARKIAEKSNNSVEQQQLVEEEEGGGGDGREQAEKLNGTQQATCLACPRHGQIGWEQNGDGGDQPDLATMCPDLLFADLENEWRVPWAQIRLGKMLGRGAFGFVFTGTLQAQFRRRMLLTRPNEQVALKLLEPLPPNAISQCSPGRASAQAFRAFAFKWHNDLMEQATRAYCTARQELCMLAELSHPSCTQMLAFCAQPMTLVLELAPNGSLNKCLAEFRRHGQRLHVETLQRATLQIAKALEYLHVQQHIIYRDLKSENVLVWRFPLPTTNVHAAGAGRAAKCSGGPADVRIKLGDYGISRFSYPSGVCKGYGGTEGFLAPEIMRYIGEQEYTERVDCFSFGMFLYELLTLRQPYEGLPLQQMKERILEAQRPMINEKELLYPTNMLDLMVMCWEERAEQRPSSSQLVGICSAPEFAHLLDMALLRDDEQMDGGMACVPYEQDANQWICWIPRRSVRRNAKRAGDEDDNAFCLLQCSNFGWTEKKLYTLHSNNNKDRNIKNARTASKGKGEQQRPPLSPSPSPPCSRITAIARICEEFLWLGDSDGKVRIFGMQQQNGTNNSNGAAVGDATPMDCSSSPPPLGPLIFTVDMAKAVECGGITNGTQQQLVQLNNAAPESQQQQQASHHEPLRRISHSLEMAPFAVQHIGTFPERQLVIVGLCTAVLLCRWHGQEAAPQIMTSIWLRNDHLFGMAILPSLGDWQIWTGHSRGHVFIHHISLATDRLTFSTSITHSSGNIDEKKKSKQGGGQSTAAAFVSSSRRSTATSAVAFLIASKCTKNLVWSVMERDSCLFMWRDSQLQRMLNCEKILPVSESLSSLELSGTEDAQMPHFITAIELLELDGRFEQQIGDGATAGMEQLIVGTSRGILLAINAAEMTPLSCFHPYSGPVERILACPNARAGSLTSRILQDELLTATTTTTMANADLGEDKQQQPTTPTSNVPCQAAATATRHAKKRSLVLEKSRLIMMKAAGMQTARQTTTLATTTATTQTKEQQQSQGSSRSNSSSNTTTTSMHTPPSLLLTSPMPIAEVTRNAVDELCEAVKSGMRGIFATDYEAAKNSSNNSERQDKGGTEAFFVTIGANYRPLLDRFVTTSQARPPDERCAIFWRATSHWSAGHHHQQPDG